MHKTLSFNVWNKQVRTGDEDQKLRGIRDKRDAGDSGDWRDPDLVLVLDGAKVYTRDEAFNAHSGAVEPDWGKGAYLMWPSNLVVDLGDNPAEIFKESLLQGRTLYGVIISRDDQIHN